MFKPAHLFDRCGWSVRVHHMTFALSKVVLLLLLVELSPRSQARKRTHPRVGKASSGWPRYAAGRFALFKGQSQAFSAVNFFFCNFP